jgi:hypothetical protein
MRIRIFSLKCWIRIRNQRIRIRNTGPKTNHEVNIRNGGKVVHVVIKYLSRPAVERGGGGGGVTPPPPYNHPI